MPSVNKPVAVAEACGLLVLKTLGADAMIGGLAARSRPSLVIRSCRPVHIRIDSNRLARGAVSATAATLTTARTESRSGQGRAMIMCQMIRQDIAFVPMRRGGGRGSTTGPRYGMGLGAPTPRPGSLNNKPSTDRQPRVPIGASCPVSTACPAFQLRASTHRVLFTMHNFNRTGGHKPNLRKVRCSG
jgi:hypothetical protein